MQSMRIRRRFNDDGIPIGSLPVESVVKLSVNGALQDFIVVNQGIPGASTTYYDTSCDGTWLMMKGLCCMMSFDAEHNDVATNKYSESDVHAYLNGDFFNTLDAESQGVIKEVKVPYVFYDGFYGPSFTYYADKGVAARFFLLSTQELNYKQTNGLYQPSDGEALSYFDPTNSGQEGSVKLVAYFEGQAKYWWTRSPVSRYNYYQWHVTPNGGLSTGSIDDGYTKGFKGHVTQQHGIRPACVVFPETKVKRIDTNTYILA